MTQIHSPRGKRLDLKFPPAAWVVLLERFSIVCWALLLSGCCEDFADARIERSFGGPGNDVASAVAEAWDGGTVLAGYTDSFGAGREDMYVVKVNQAGERVWSRTLGGPGNERAYEIIAVSTGGFLVAGGTDSAGSGGMDMFVIRLDESGSALWERTFGGSGNEIAFGVSEAADGGFVLCGYSEPVAGGRRDAYVVRTDEAGEVVWQQTYGATPFSSANAIIAAADGAFFAVGEQRATYDAVSCVYVVCIEEDGRVRWERTSCEGDPEVKRRGVDVCLNAAGQFVVLCDRLRPDPEVEFRRADLMVYDSEGTLMQETNTGLHVRTFEPRAIAKTHSNGFVIAGVARDRASGCRDVYITTVGDNLGFVSGAPMGAMGKISEVYDIQTARNGSYQAAGMTAPSDGSGASDVYFIHTDDDDLRDLQSQSSLY